MQFTYPTFLFALFSLLIPIIIHLFQLRRYKKMVFSDIRFLKQITEQNQKQRNIKEWIILAARCLALACLVFAFAKPFIPNNNQKNVHANKVITVFIDNSFSMSQQNKEGQLLEVAKNKAREVLSFYNDNDLFQILTNDFEGRHQQLINKKDFLTYLDEVKISNESKTYEQIKSRQKQALEQSTQSTNIAYYISDFQQNQFNNLQANDSNLLVNLMPIRPAVNNNISIDSVWIEQPLILPNTSTTLFVKVSNHGITDFEEIPLNFKIDNSSKGIANISCKANNSITTSFKFTLNDILFHEAEVSILDNPVVFDDKLFFTLKAYGNQNVIAINANKDISKIYNLDSNFKLISFSENAIDYSLFNQSACIVLNEITNFSTGLQTSLQNYISNGGVVLLIPNANLQDADKTNQFLKQINAPQLVQQSNANLKIARLNTFDEVFKNAFDKIPENSNWPVLIKSYAMQINSNNKGYNIATLNNDMPFIFKSKYGKGAVYLLNSCLQASWNNFANHALFVPFMLRLPLVNKNSQALYYNLDKKLNYVFEKNTNSKVLYVRLNKTESAFDVNNSNGKSAIYITGLKQAGTYQVFEKNNKTSIANISFNSNRNESNVSYIDNKTLESAKAQMIDANDLLKHQKQIELNFNEVQLWRWFVIAALLFILLEVVLLKLKF